MQFPNLCGTLRCIDKLMTTDAFMIIFKMWVQRSASDENWAAEWLLGGEGRSGDIMWVQKLNQGQGHLCQILLLPLKIGYKQWKQTFLLAQDGAWDQLTSGTCRVCSDQRPSWSIAQRAKQCLRMAVLPKSPGYIRKWLANTESAEVPLCAQALIGKRLGQGK